MPDTTSDRLEYLRAELRAERISYGELAELQALTDHIDPSDVELLEAAGVPEFEETYSVIRFYFDPNLPRAVIAEGLTLEEAQAHCNDPDTSSSTATSDDAIAHTAECGPWFDGYEEE